MKHNTDNKKIFNILNEKTCYFENNLTLKQYNGIDDDIEKNNINIYTSFSANVKLKNMKLVKISN